MGEKEGHGTAPPAVDMEQAGIAANRQFTGEQKSDNKLLSHPLDFLFCFNSCFIVPERTNLVELWFGNYYGTITEPGCYCRNSCFFELRNVSTALRTIDLPNIKVIDARGSPLIVSGIVTYEVVDARSAAIVVTDSHKYVSDLAPVVLKRVVASYPYEPRDDTPNETSLRSDTEEVSLMMRDALQTRCGIAGVRIDQFQINELSYAPEIAQAMLKRQQAEALIDARRSIVAGAKEIALSTVADVGDNVNSSDRSKLLSNLLVVLVGEQDVTPTLNIGQ